MQFDFTFFMRFFGEFTATAVFVSLGCMGSATNDQDANSNLISSLHFGLAMMIVMHIFGFISGAHVNPCISVACNILGYITPEMAVCYVVAQVLGACFGYSILLVLLPDEMIEGNKPGVCMVNPMNSLTLLQIFGIEFFLTTVLILGWCALWDVRNGRFLDSVTLRMGLLVAACCFAGGQLTGAGMNPAKTLAPALFVGKVKTVCIHIVGQLSAAIFVPFVWRYLCTPQYSRLVINSVQHSLIS